MAGVACMSVTRSERGRTAVFDLEARGGRRGFDPPDPCIKAFQPLLASHPATSKGNFPVVSMAAARDVVPGERKASMNRQHLNFASPNDLRFPVRPDFAEAGKRALKRHGSGEIGAAILFSQYAGREAIEEAAARCHGAAGAALFRINGYRANEGLLAAATDNFLGVDGDISQPPEFKPLKDPARAGLSNLCFAKPGCTTTRLISN